MEGGTNVKGTGAREIKEMHANGTTQAGFKTPWVTVKRAEYGEVDPDYVEPEARAKKQKATAMDLV